MSQLFNFQFLTPWQNSDQPFNSQPAQLSNHLRSALVCSTSLTRHLETRLKQTIEVEIIEQVNLQSWEDNPQLWGEQQDLPDPESVTYRNAWLIAGNQKLLFAHSQLVTSGLHESILKQVKEGNLPLGSLFLQHEKTIERKQLELAQARIPALATRLGEEVERTFWCRRSIFLVNNLPFARILEVFLTDLDYPDSLPG
ncbi:MAG: chorismate lyase [Magnetococcales bacterium]|nr:chorismate lyase [Magnetococcales bacterium]